MFKKLLFVLIALTLIALPVARPAHAFGGVTTDWSAIQSDATTIHDQAMTLEQEAFQLRQNAVMIQNQETDPEVVAQAAQIADMAAQIEQDAASIVTLADDINDRIDHSEVTTLALSDDIGEMADRIGVMADRILWTQLQIGVMADRIVVSEFLISDSSLALAQDVQESNQAMSAQSAQIKSADTDIQQQLF